MSPKELAMLTAMKEGIAIRVATLESRIKQLQAIVDLLPTKDGSPVVPGVDPEDGTAERLGVIFRYSIES